MTPLHQRASHRHKSAAEKTKAACSGFPFGASGDYSLQLVSVQSSYPNQLGSQIMTSEFKKISAKLGNELWPKPKPLKLQKPNYNFPKPQPP